MERKRLIYWGIQIVGWTLYFVFSILLVMANENFSLTKSIVIFAILSILAAIILSHGIRYVIISQSLMSRSAERLILITLLLAILASLIMESFQFVIESYITEMDYMPQDEEEEQISWTGFLLGVTRQSILFLVWCGFYYVYAIIEKSREQEILNLKWQASKNEIELKNLRAQLNPHFLFNSLNSIRALVGLNPEQSKKSITQLSNLLRKSINLGKLRVIPLKEELDLVKIYLELEKVRFEERLQVTFNIDDQTLSSEIPPLMLQTIVENCIKHGISQSIDGGIIHIASKKEKHELVLEIRNTGILDEDYTFKGIGISNTEKRLAILFGKNGSFDIRQEDEEVIVTIKILYR